MRILIVEDNERLGHSLVSGLTAQGYTVDLANDGEKGWAAASEAVHDLIILDRMLPGIDGLTLLRRLRTSGSMVPVLLLTALDGIDERVSGLDTGADDYLAKPFAVSELLARIRALTRRGHHRADPVVVLGDLELDPAGRCARRKDRRIDLTPKEYRALELLAARRGTVVTRQELHNELHPGEDPTSNAVDVLIGRLRRKLHPPGAAMILHTRRGFGYELADDAG